MVVTKDYRIIETQQKSAIAQLSILHRIIRFFLAAFTPNQEKTAGHGVF